MVSRAELSSIATALNELSERITDAADKMLGGPHEGVSVDLYEVDRSLRTARRRLEGAAEGLPD